MQDITEAHLLRILNSSAAEWVLFWSILVLLVVVGVIVYRRLRRRDTLQLSMPLFCAIVRLSCSNGTALRTEVSMELSYTAVQCKNSQAIPRSSMYWTGCGTLE